MVYVKSVGLRLIMSALVFVYFSCDPEESREVGSNFPPEDQDTIALIDYSSYQQVYAEDSSLSFMMPQDWRIKGMVFYDSTGEKIGEIAPGILKPEEEISGREYLKRLENAGPDIQADPVSYSFGDDYDYIYGDTLDLAGTTWYLGKTSSPFESATGDHGFWYPHHYFRKISGSTGEDKFFIITFYSGNESFEEEEQRQILNILRTVEAKG